MKKYESFAKGISRFAILLAFLLVNWTTLFAQQSQTSSQAEDLYNRGMNELMGVGPNQNNLTAIDLLRRSADIGYDPAQTAIGYAYETGFELPTDEQTAAYWYRKAAQHGDSLGAWALGRLYFLGKIPGSHNEAEQWLSQAADTGNPFGEYLLGLSLHRRDSSKGVKDLQSAAGQGLPFAQFQLGIALQNGLGIALDKQAAYVWLLVSFDAGVQQASAPLLQLQSELGAANVEHGKAKARELESAVSRTLNAHGCTGWNGELDEIPTPPPIELQRFCR